MKNIALYPFRLIWAILKVFGRAGKAAAGVTNPEGGLQWQELDGYDVPVRFEVYKTIHMGIGMGIYGFLHIGDGPPLHIAMQDNYNARVIDPPQKSQAAA